MTDDNFPALYRASDAASLMAQRTHFQLLKGQLSLFFVASVLVVAAGLLHERVAAAAAAVVLVASLAITWIGRAKTYERVWFDCRAIAESAKSATWRFVTAAAPFATTAENVEQIFLNELREIRTARAGAEAALIGTGLMAGDAITQAMRSIRKADLVDRKEIYLRERLGNQLDWYTRKSQGNKGSADNWFRAIIAMQLLAVVISIAKVAYIFLPLNTVSLAMTGAASFVAWSQAKRFDDLVEPYALAAQELSEIRATANRINSEESLSEFVEQAEGTISREHKMWCARRRVRITE